MTSWDTVINSNSSKVSFKDLLNHKDLLTLLVKRDIVTIYKQTILGPTWYFIQPILTTLMFTLIFGKVAKITTDGIPHIPFYLMGITFWSYFSECFLKISNTFRNNQGLFGKVYFPRIIVPLSIVISSLGKLLIQFTLFIVVYLYYLKDNDFSYNVFLFLIPFIVVNFALISLGAGMLITSLTTKYRDLMFLISFSIQLLMYATPIIYPSSIIPQNLKTISHINPFTNLIETLRYSFFGSGELEVVWLLYSFVFGVVIFILGCIVFNRVERNFMDSI